MKSIPVEPKQSGFRGRRGDPSKAQRCGAKTRGGTPCRAPAMVNPQTGRRLRCKFHGGASTGPRTSEGRARVTAASFKHGRFTNAAKAAKKAAGERLAALKAKTKGVTR